MQTIVVPCPASRGISSDLVPQPSRSILYRFSRKMSRIQDSLAPKRPMFTPLHPAISKRRVTSLSVSLSLHFVFLGWLLRSPAPIFVAPFSVVKCQSGSSLTRIYFGGDSGVSQEQPKPRLTWQRPPKNAS